MDLIDEIHAAHVEACENAVMRRREKEKNPFKVTPVNPYEEAELKLFCEIKRFFSNGELSYEQTVIGLIRAKRLIDSRLNALITEDDL